MNTKINKLKVKYVKGGQNKIISKQNTRTNTK